MTKELKRYLKIKLPHGQSAFLWGPRKTGKTTYLKHHFPESLVFDFLDTDLFFETARRPAIIRERILAAPKQLQTKPIILDEVQKVPQMLDEVHRLMEEQKLSFILCGSSARKLKRGHANLLGGRAWRYELFPLVSTEISAINLLRALNHGLIPAHYLQNESQCRKSLKSYIQDYLKEEVFAEGLARNIPAFARFFDALAFSQGEMVNYAKVASDCGVDAKTVREYFQILVDTLVGIMIEPFSRHGGRQIILKAPKFYLFDVGIAGALAGRTITAETGSDFGRSFEHFILMELNAYRSYSGKDFDINYWRTKTGLEVDFVLGRGHTAIEVKASRLVRQSDLRPLKAFIEEYSPQTAYVVCNESAGRVVGKIYLKPWRIFLEALWSGKII
ncbi:MAG: ATP-binding protein [Elusimicrobia bacterium]|nr:ATP-binding protein [Elusimicrobiota bacterium]